MLALLNPPKGTLDYLFELYRKKLSAGRYDELTSIPVGNRTPLECKELEIIQLWNNSPVSTEKIADEVEVEDSPKQFNMAFSGIDTNYDNNPIHKALKVLDSTL